MIFLQGLLKPTPRTDHDVVFDIRYIREAWRSFQGRKGLSLIISTDPRQVAIDGLLCHGMDSQWALTIL